MPRERSQGDPRSYYHLYLHKQISGDGFRDLYAPAEERMKQLNVELPKLEAEVDFLKVNKLSADDVLHEAATLYDRWPKLPFEDKRKIVEALIEKITIGGDLIDRILGVIPPERIEDVVLVDPSDAEFSVGFNILPAHSELEKNLLASDLIAVFQRLSASWGDQMNSVLQNGILAFLESDRRGTLADLRRFLIEPTFRNEFLKSVKDSEVVYEIEIEVGLGVDPLRRALVGIARCRVTAERWCNQR